MSQSTIVLQVRDITTGALVAEFTRSYYSRVGGFTVVGYAEFMSRLHPGVLFEAYLRDLRFELPWQGPEGLLLAAYFNGRDIQKLYRPRW